LQLCAYLLLGFLALQLFLFLHVCSHHVVEVAVGLRASCDSGWRRAIVFLLDSFLYGVDDSFCARDVSLALLQSQ
jgi:hypothetical protein